VRGLDLVEEARASLEFAAHAWPASAATRHGAGRHSSPRRWASGYLTCSSRPGKRCLTSPRRSPPHCPHGPVR
jgi:hypothetical protein